MCAHLELRIFLCLCLGRHYYCVSQKYFYASIQSYNIWFQNRRNFNHISRNLNFYYIFEVQFCQNFRKIKIFSWKCRDSKIFGVFDAENWSFRAIIAFLSLPFWQVTPPYCNPGKYKYTGNNAKTIYFFLVRPQYFLPLVLLFAHCAMKMTRMTNHIAIIGERSVSV